MADSPAKISGLRTLRPAKGADAFTWLLAGILGLVTAWLFWPGLMSFDSLYVYRQVTGDLAVQNYHPPVMVYAWRLGHWLAGPGSMLLLHQLVYWSAWSLLAIGISNRGGVRLIIVFTAGLLPPLWISSATIWNDVGVMSSFLLASACCIVLGRNGARRVFVLALVALTYGLAAKRAALFAAIPLFIGLADAWLSSRPLRGKGDPGPRSGIGTTTILAWSTGLFAGALAIGMLINSIGAQPHTKWTTIAIWDLAAVSLAEQTLLVPESAFYTEFANEGEALARLEANFDQDVNGTLNEVVNLFPVDGNEAQIWKAWLALPLDHPTAYLSHRWKVWARLLGLGEQPVRLAFQGRVVANDYGIEPIHGETRVFALATGWVRASVATVIYRPWVYLAVLLAILAFTLARPQLLRDSQYRFIAYLGASGLLYVLPLFFLAPATDFRYTLWMLACTVVMVILVACRWPQRS